MTTQAPTILERYVAIDNVCAWPNLARLPDGEVVAAIFNQPTHGGWEGQVECWGSTDDGRTWERRGVPVPHEPGVARMNHGFGLATDGALVAIVGGHGGRPARGAKADLDFSKAEWMHPRTARSIDGGRTWQPGAPIPKGEDGWRVTAFGPIASRADGALFASFYSWPPPSTGIKNRGSAYLYRSDDQGATWARHALIAPDDYNETSIHFVGEKRCLAAARTFKDQTVHLFVSDDGGDSWRFHAPLTSAYEHNGHLMTLPDGRVLLTYGVRHPGDLALECRVSPDGGERWGRPHRLLRIDDVERYDGGYPSCVAIGDDKVLTAYYTRRAPGHQRYHMGVLIWDWKREFDHGFDR